MANRQLHAFIALTLLATGAQAQQAPAITPFAQAIDTLLLRFSDDSKRFSQTGGEALYRTSCQACHLEDGRGATGAGAHPPLAGNPKMKSKHFVAGVILTGYHGMPRFGNMMSDEQVAAVTNYVRTHFGNDYSDPITPGQVDTRLLRREGASAGLALSSVALVRGASPCRPHDAMTTPTDPTEPQPARAGRYVPPSSPAWRVASCPG